jgi:hypothetical protein
MNGFAVRDCLKGLLSQHASPLFCPRLTLELLHLSSALDAFRGCSGQEE